MKKLLIESFITDKYAFVIIPDPAAGRKNRFTTYRLDLQGAKRAKIIGRELDKRFSRKVVQSWAKYGRWVM